MQEVDLVMMAQYKDIDLDEDPVFVLKCGHLFTRETLDGVMTLTDAYDIDQEGKQFCHPRYLHACQQSDRQYIVTLIFPSAWGLLNNVYHWLYSHVKHDMTMVCSASSVSSAWLRTAAQR